MKQLVLALHNYESSHTTFPPSRLNPDVEIEDNAGKYSAYQSWTTMVLPYIDQGNLGNQINYQAAWSSLQNRPAVSQQLSAFQCPSTPGADRKDGHWVIGAAAGDYGSVNEVKKKVYTDVLGVSDPGTCSRAGVLSKGVKNKIRDITDGASNSIIIAEAAGQPSVYTADGPMNAARFALYSDDKIADLGGGNGPFEPADGTGWADPDCGFSINGATADGLDKYGPYMINRINVSEVFSFHIGGAQVGLADGSIRFLSENIDTSVFIGVCTRAGGEVVGEW